MFYRENFNDMGPAQKVRSIARNLELLIEELPVFLLRLEDDTSAFDEKLVWREFKFCFKVGTSKVVSTFIALPTSVGIYHAIKILNEFK